jgi:hypothetical protein
MPQRMARFIEAAQKFEALWRFNILFDRNMASYKFTLGKELLELAERKNIL